MIDWHGMRDVYGSAADIPVLLGAAAASTDWEAPAWQELWSRLYHQDSVAPASYAALPALAQIASGRPEVAVDPALFLVAAIISAEARSPRSTQARAEHSAAIAALGPVAEHKLALVADQVEFVWALHTVAALTGSPAWAHALQGLANEEIELECPICQDHIYLELSGNVLVATADPDDLSAAQPVLPADLGSLDAAQAHLLGLCNAHGRADTAASILQLSGEIMCPHCRARFRLGEALA